MRRMMALAAAGATALLAGCTDVPLTAPETSAHPATAPARWSSADRLAKVLALGLHDPVARAHLRDALRASPVNEHRVLLQQFAMTEDGKVLVAAAAEASHVPASEVYSLIAALPPTDVVIPFTTHRLSWKATGDVMVGVLAHRRDSLLTGYTPDGGTVSVNGWHTPAATLVVLEPARGKDLRIDAQPAGRRGTVVQDADDGELAGSISVSLGKGRWGVAQLAHFMTARGARPGELLRKRGVRPQVQLLVACDPAALDCQSADPPPDATADTGATVIQPGDTTYYLPSELDDSVTAGAGPSLVSGTAPPDTTRLIGFVTHYEDAPWDSYVEPYFKARYLGALSVVRFKHIKAGKWYLPNTPLIFRRYVDGTLDYVEVEVWEDNAWDTDVHCEYRQGLGSSENNKILRYGCGDAFAVDYAAGWNMVPRPPVATVQLRQNWGTYDEDKALYAGCESAADVTVRAWTAGGAELDISKSPISLASDHPEAATLVFDPLNATYHFQRFKIYANGPGGATLRATVEGVSDQIIVSVRTGVTSVVVTPPSAMISAGANQQLTATAYMGTKAVNTCWMSMGATGYEYPMVPTVWRSDSPAVATVSQTGLVSGVSSGTSTVHASIGVFDGTSAISVTSVSRVAVSPASATIDVAGKVQLAASPLDFTGSPVPGKTVTWSSANTTVATVSTTGLVTGRAGGLAYIYATVDGVRGTSAVTVRSPLVPPGDCGTRKVC